jgi:hypothetical protein
MLVLCWRLYLLEDGQPPRRLEEGLAYPDDLPEWDPTGHQTLTNYAAANGAGDIEPGFSRMGGSATLRCEPLSWWLHRRLYLHGYNHRERCDIVGLNLLFDFGRIAQHWAPARGDYHGGWSLGFWGEYSDGDQWRDAPRHPRLRARAIDPRRTLFEWGSIGEDPHFWKGRGRFVDLRTLAFALTDRGHTLESACKAFDVPYQKRETELGKITDDLLAYAREDVEATARLYLACLEELARHEGIHLDAHRLYSPATIGTRYLEAMGYPRPLEQFTNLTPEQLGWTRGTAASGERREAAETTPNGEAITPQLLGHAMSAFYGGRAEARIVRTPVPVALVDFTSMYPSVNALLGTRSLLTAERIHVQDATDDVRTMLGNPGLVDWCLQPNAWSEIGVTLVEVEPNGAVLPVRAKYDPASGDFGIGVNPFQLDDGAVWYALPDVIAAAILDPTAARALTVRRALRLVGQGIQASLRPATLRGGRELDPRRDDPFLAMIEERHRVAATDPRQERFLKVTANSTSYGVLARFDRRERATPTTVQVYGPDDEPFDATTAAPEDPGPYCFPPVAASITAAARLMLALLERLVEDQGGAYAFCDTDSLAIVATPRRKRVRTEDGQTVTALSFTAVRKILDRFEPLNPYDRSVIVGSPWSVKFISLTSELWCYAISAKRYALYHLNHGTPELVGVRDQPEDDANLAETGEDVDAEYVDWSEHGLGLYLDPTTTDPDSSPRDKKGRRLWIRGTWEWVLDDAHGGGTGLPEWADRFALTRFTLSGPRTAAWFDGYNAARPRQKWIRPGSFGLLAHPAPGFRSSQGALPAAPYEVDPTAWPMLPWYDRGTGHPVEVTAATSLFDSGGEVSTDGAVPIQTIGDVIHRYRLRPEHKSLDPDRQPARRDSRGQLHRRPVQSTLTLQQLVGKEGNKLLERQTSEIADSDDYRADYGSRGETWPIVVAAVRVLGAAAVSRRSGLHRRTIERAVRGAEQATMPHRANQARIAAATAAEARDRLSRLGETPPSGTLPTLLRYLQL